MKSIDKGAGDAQRARPASERSGAARVLFCCLLLAAAVLTVFFRTLRADFVYWDDNIHILDNPYLSPLTTSNLGYFWTHPYEHLYIPISYTVFALIAQLSRMPYPDPNVTALHTLYNPEVFHATNLLLHMANVLLVFAILRRLLRTRVGDGRSVDVAALFGALLFALHPLQVESVAWISELRGLLSGLFFFAAVMAYLQAVGGPRERGVFARAGYWLAVVFGALAMLSKPTAVSLLFALFALDRWIVGRSPRACFVAVLPFLLLALPFIAATHSAQAVSQVDVAPLWERPFIAGHALAFYLWKLLWPAPLTIDYGLRPVVVMHHFWGYTAWILPAVVAALAYAGRRNRPWFVAAGLFSVAVLLPVIGLAPFAFQEFSTVADRYVYVAMFGPALALSFVLVEARGARALVYSLPVLVVVACGLLSMRQVRLWHDSFTLFQYAVRLNPLGWGMRANYGAALRESGRVPEAIEQFEASLKIEPNTPSTENDLAVAYLKSGRPAAAAALLETAIRQNPDDPVLHDNLGIAYQDLGRTNDPVQQFQAAVQLQPTANNYDGLGDSLAACGRFSEAAVAYQKAFTINSSFPEPLYGLGQALEQLGRLSEAESVWRNAVRLAADSTRAHVGLAEVLAQEGQNEQALAEYQAAEGLGDGSADTHYQVGCLLFEGGDKNGAVAELTRAVSIEPSSPQYHGILGVVEASTGNTAAARREFEAVLRLDPTSAMARKQLDALGVR